MIDAPLSNETALGKLTSATTGDDATATELIRLIESYTHQPRHARAGAA